MWNTDAKLVDVYVGHFDSARGMVREELVDRHLLDQLGQTRLDGLEIVDFGSGAGNQALRFAERGCRATLVEPSPLMMERAEKRLAGMSAETRARVTLMLEDAETAAARLPKGGFDVAMSHGVLMYLDSPEPLLSAMVAAVRPGGLVSALTKSSEALAARAGFQGDFAAALSTLDQDDTSRGWLGVDTRGDSVRGLTEILSRLGAESPTWRGVGVFSDHRDDLDGLSDEALTTLVELEHRVAALDPYRSMARLIHVLARKAA